MTREELIAMLKEVVSLEMQTSSEYTGGMRGDGLLYSNVTTINLVVAGETISSITVGG